jgi:hypothetical protein
VLDCGKWIRTRTSQGVQYQPKPNNSARSMFDLKIQIVNKSVPALLNMAKI